MFFESTRGQHRETRSHPVNAIARFAGSKQVSILRRSSSLFRPVETLETPPGNRRHTVAKAETTGYARAFRRAVDSKPRGHSRSAA